MDGNIVLQMKVFFFSILLGILLSGCYDGWKLFWKSHDKGVFFSDTLFWMLTGIILFLFTEWENEGNIRGYLFLGWFLGWFLYRKLFQKMLRRIWIWIIEILKKVRKNVKMIIERR